MKKSFPSNFDLFNISSISSIEIGPLLVHATFGKHSNNPSKLIVFGKTNLFDIKCNLKYASDTFSIGFFRSTSDQSSLINS